MISGETRVPWVTLAVDCLEWAKESGDCDDQSIEKVAFLSEQLSLVGVAPKQRRYCPSLLLSAYLLYASSPNVMAAGKATARPRSLAEPLRATAGHHRYR